MFTEAKANWNGLHAGMAEQMGEALSLLANGLSAMTSDAQKRVLSTSLVPEKWKARLSAFTWEVREERDIILPDSVAIAFDAHGQATPLVLSDRSEEHTSELQSLMRISYAVFCLKKKKQTQ